MCVTPLFSLSKVFHGQPEGVHLAFDWMMCKESSPQLCVADSSVYTASACPISVFALFICLQSSCKTPGSPASLWRVSGAAVANGSALLAA